MNVENYYHYMKTKEPSKEVKKLTLEKISQLDEKLKQLKNLKDELTYLADNCHGDDRPNCPILMLYLKMKHF